MIRSSVLFKAQLIMLTLAVCCGPSAAQTTSAQRSTPENYLEILVRAQTKTDAKEWVEAAALWEKVVAVNPVEGRFWNQLAAAHYNPKNYPASLPRGAVSIHRLLRLLRFKPGRATKFPSQVIGMETTISTRYKVSDE